MIKQLIAVMALLAVVLGPEAALATTSIQTSLERGTGGGVSPIVKAKWEMWDTGKDDSIDAGAQFLPSGKYGVGKKIQVCGVVTDPDGVADVNAVYADVYYPTAVALGPDHEADRQGCGQVVGTECKMVKKDKTTGWNLFCDTIRNRNNNLPTFFTGYNYDEICKADGELMKETAYVYCCEKELSYEDPSGNYRTLVFAQDMSGNDSNYLTNNFAYLPVTAFETDFTKIAYGNVRLNTEKIINGDLVWNSPADTGLASVRNIGNTRLAMQVTQDDMGLGMTGSTYNVKYKGRVGNNQADWVAYNPFAQTTLQKELNLSETEEMDFGITITKFPPETASSYTGAMTLGAMWANHLCCEGTQCASPI